MKYKLALVVIPEHWDASELCHPSVNESGFVIASDVVEVMDSLPENPDSLRRTLAHYVETIGRFGE